MMEMGSVILLEEDGDLELCKLGWDKVVGAKEG